MDSLSNSTRSVAERISPTRNDQVALACGRGLPREFLSHLARTRSDTVGVRVAPVALACPHFTTISDGVLTVEGTVGDGDIAATGLRCQPRSRSVSRGRGRHGRPRGRLRSEWDERE